VIVLQEDLCIEEYKVFCYTNVDISLKYSFDEKFTGFLLEKRFFEVSCAVDITSCFIPSGLIGLILLFSAKSVVANSICKGIY